ncbi:MAG TPA: hypothetical protein VIK33_06200 [Anaerolineae bacterium]
MHRLERFWSNLSSQTALGAGVTLGRVAQQEGGDTTVQTLITILVLVTIFLPIIMGVIGGATMRFLTWFTRDSQTIQDEVVMPAPTLPAGIHMPEPTIWPAVLAFGLMGVMFSIALRSWVLLGAAMLLIVLGLAGWVVLEVQEFRARRR